MKTIDKWESIAKADTFLSRDGHIESRDFRSERIIQLIELIRAKDKLLKDNRRFFGGDFGDSYQFGIVNQCLALTDSLGAEN